MRNIWKNTTKHLQLDPILSILTPVTSQTNICKLASYWTRAVKSGQSATRKHFQTVMDVWQEKTGWNLNKNRWKGSLLGTRSRWVWVHFIPKTRHFSYVNCRVQIATKSLPNWIKMVSRTSKKFQNVGTMSISCCLSLTCNYFESPRKILTKLTWRQVSTVRELFKCYLPSWNLHINSKDVGN